MQRRQHCPCSQPWREWPPGVDEATSVIHFSRGISRFSKYSGSLDTRHPFLTDTFSNDDSFCFSDSGSFCSGCHFDGGGVSDSGGLCSSCSFSGGDSLSVFSNFSGRCSRRSFSCLGCSGSSSGLKLYSTCSDLGFGNGRPFTDSSGLRDDGGFSICGGLSDNCSSGYDGGFSVCGALGLDFCISGLLVSICSVDSAVEPTPLILWTAFTW